MTTDSQPKELDRILWDIPREIETDRLIIRAPRRGDSALITPVKNKNLEHLKPWFPFAQKPSTTEEDETFARKTLGDWETNTDFTMLIFNKESMQYIGGCGLHARKKTDWDLRRFEIGYWIDKGHEGQGLITETANALTRFAFDVLKANLVIIRADTDNTRSRAVPERLGFKFTGVVESEDITTSGTPKDVAYYSRKTIDGLPELTIKY